MPESNPFDRANKEAMKFAQVSREIIPLALQIPKIRSYKDWDPVTASKTIVTALVEHFPMQLREFQHRPELLMGLAQQIFIELNTSVDDTIERKFEIEFSEGEIFSRISVADDWYPYQLTVREITKDHKGRIVKMEIAPREDEEAMHRFGAYVFYTFSYPYFDTNTRAWVEEVPVIERSFEDAEGVELKERPKMLREKGDRFQAKESSLPEVLFEYENGMWHRRDL